MENKSTIRINKYLADQKYCSRKEADNLIKKGLVLINGKKAILGQMVKTSDQVRIVNHKNNYKYYAYYKPAGILTDNSNDRDLTIKDKLKIKGVFPVGRLDKESEGLIILTNDGRITDPLLNPKKDHQKEYLVSVKEKIKPSFKTKMEKGVNIEGYVTKKCQVKTLDDYTFNIILTEGKKHQIRRMCANLGYTVRTLKRTRIMNIKLKDLKPNDYKTIEGEELKKFLSLLEI